MDAAGELSLRERPGRELYGKSIRLIRFPPKKAFEWHRLLVCGVRGLTQVDRAIQDQVESDRLNACPTDSRSDAQILWHRLQHC